MGNGLSSSCAVPIDRSDATLEISGFISIIGLSSFNIVGCVALSGATRSSKPGAGGGCNFTARIPALWPSFAVAATCPSAATNFTDPNVHPAKGSIVPTCKLCAVASGTLNRCKTAVSATGAAPSVAWNASCQSIGASIVGASISETECFF